MNIIVIRKEGGKQDKRFVPWHLIANRRGKAGVAVYCTVFLCSCAGGIRSGGRRVEKERLKKNTCHQEQQRREKERQRMIFIG